MNYIGRCLITYLSTWLVCFCAYADETRPLFIEIEHLSQYTYSTKLNVPSNIPIFNTPHILLPADCQLIPYSNATPGLQRYQCDSILSGREVTIDYPNFISPVSSIAKFIGISGDTHTDILRPGQTVWRIPQAETKSSVAVDYTGLGMYHIWAGADHLLFILCLIWIAQTLPRILATITGFTLAHSATLVLSAMDILQVPIAPVEALIALSVMFLAVEIAKERRNSLTWKYPITISSSFGLLHGLGFAAVLNEIGLPQTERVLGLLFFNLGVELGQVIFALAAIAGLYILKRLSSYWMNYETINTNLRYILSYGIGCTASYWLIDRVAAF